ncbi:MAG: polysaccharide deacetylase family protein [Anaerolineae bacterium]
MLEVLIPLLVIIALAAAGGIAWRRLRGPATSPWAVLGRAGVVVLLPALLVAWGSWRLMKTPHFQVVGRLVDRVETGERVVALTFDDGPTAKYTDEVLGILREEGVRATFFVIGTALERDLSVCQSIAAAGHELGNHSYSHWRMVLRPYGDIRDEIERTDAVIRQCGYEGEIHFRPPNGKKFLLLPFYLARNGRTDVLWDVAPEGDRQVAADDARITEYVLDRVRPGSIVLLHLMYESRAESRQALPAIIQGLKARGYRFVTISELLSAGKAQN